MEKIKTLYTLIIAIVFSLTIIYAQNTNNVTIQGTVVDTSKKEPLSNVLILASRFSDSIIVSYVRTNNNGTFKLQLPIDTFQISFHHSNFGEKFIFVITNEKNNFFDFGKVILPPKEFQLEEVVIYADREPVYYKGDTLVYIADSFKVKPDATVEDLLKKLPGIQVDKTGKIKVQGKNVDKVLVDGDEFFGTDPTTATKNLQAKQVENIQVYEQKNQENNNNNNNDKETLQVLNIQLKEEVRKGYFGKLYAGSDGQKFYEAQGLFNRFTNNQKISIYAMSGNTPNFNLDWSDINKYGLDDEIDIYFLNDDEMVYTYSSESKQGIPQVSKGAIYFNNKWNKIKLNTNYSAYQNILKTTEKEYSQYFLTDSNYYSDKKSYSHQQNDVHKLNLNLKWQIDSLNTFEITSKNIYSQDKRNYTETADFFNKNNFKFRTSSVDNSYSAASLKSNNTINYQRIFSKKDRELSAKYSITYDNNQHTGNLHFNNTYYITMPTLPNFNQQKIKWSEIYYHKVVTKFIEPLNKYWKLNIIYDYQFSIGVSKWNTFNPNTQNDYVILDSTFSNIFQPSYSQHVPELTINFNKQKIIFSLGMKYRFFDIKNKDIFNQQTIHYKVTNSLPYIRFTYKINKTTNLNLNYRLSSKIPGLQHIQPIQNNNNPNNIIAGNPYLLPTLEHNFRMNFYTYRPVSDQYLWCGGNYTFKERDFSNTIYYDNTGRSIEQSINTNNNFTANFYLGSTFNFFKKLFQLSSFYNYTTYKYQNLINNQINLTKNQTHYIGITPSVNIEKEKYTWNFSVNFDYTYNIPSATLNNQTNQPYYIYNYGATTSLQLFERFSLETELNYQVYNNYAQGYNPKPFIWNATLGAKIDKKKNLRISALIHDILNQNIFIQRFINTNVITDKQVNTIRKYFLVQITYNFNNTGNTSDDEEE